LTFLQTNVTHDFHLSKTDIHYKSDQKSLQLTVHLFIDDLELALGTYSNEKLNLFGNNESVLSDSLIALYLKDHLAISLDKKPVHPIYLGREMSEDLAGVWCYLELNDIDSFRKIHILNSLLISTFDDQKNIINIKVDNKSKAFHILDKKDNNKDVIL
jgi:hypothetical protein